MPPGHVGVPDAIDRGHALYDIHCALCHGEAGNGQGMRRTNLSGEPTAFASPAWRNRADPQQIYTVIVEGKRGTSMPSWRWLPRNERADLTAYLISLAGGTP